jgi:hypothetical protein
VKDVVRNAGQITEVVIRDGKGGKMARQAVTTRTAGAVAAWLADRDRLAPTAGPLFCTISEGQATGYSPTGAALAPGRQVATAYVRQFVKRAGVKAGLRMDVHPHLLRHTAITRYLRANRDLELTRKFARHADITTTARVYAHLVHEDVVAGIANLPCEQAAAPALDLAGVLAELTPQQKQALAAALLADANGECRAARYRRARQNSTDGRQRFACHPQRPRGVWARAGGEDQWR